VIDGITGHLMSNSQHFSFHSRFWRLDGTAQERRRTTCRAPRNYGRNLL